MEGLVNWVLLFCWCCMSRTSAHGILFSAFYGPSRPPDLTSSSTVTTPAPTSSTLQYLTLTFGREMSSVDPVVSTVYVTTSTPTTTTPKTTPPAYLHPNTSTLILTSTARLSQSTKTVDSDQQLDTLLELARNISNSTSLCSTTSLTTNTVTNVSKANQQYYDESNVDTLGGLISGCVVGVLILLLACIAGCIFVGHRRNTVHEMRPEEGHDRAYVSHYVMAPPIVYRF